MIKLYPDGTSYASISQNTNPEFVFRLNTYTDLWHLNQIVDAFNRINIRPIITIPNLIDAQADRNFGNNTDNIQSSGLKLICNFLGQMKANFRIFHPHNPEIVEALLNNVDIIDNSDFIKTVIYNYLCLGPGFPDVDSMNNLILMSSDAGGFKPLMKLADKIGWKGETFGANKARSWDEEDGTKFVQQIDRNDFGGKDILIIDDLSIYGGTFKGLSKLLRDKNVGKLYLAVSHMTIENLGKSPVTEYFDYVFTTNSKYDTYFVPDGEGGTSPSNLTVIKLF